MKTPREKIKEMLTEYPFLKNKINTLDKIAGKEHSIRELAYSHPAGGKINNIYQEIEEYIINTVGSQQALKDLIMLVNCIEESMKMLTDNERYITICKYNWNSEELTNGEIKDELGYSSKSSITYNHNKAIDKIKDSGLYKNYNKFLKLLNEIE